MRSLRAARTKTVHRHRGNSNTTAPVTIRAITISKIIITNTTTEDGRGAAGQGAAISLEVEEVAADTRAAGATEAAAAVTGAGGGAVGAEGEAARGTTTGKTEPTLARSRRQSNDFESSPSSA